MQERYAFALRLVRLGAKTTSQESNCRFDSPDFEPRIASPWSTSGAHVPRIANFAQPNDVYLGL